MIAICVTRRQAFAEREVFFGLAVHLLCAGVPCGDHAVAIGGTYGVVRKIDEPALAGQQLVRLVALVLFLILIHANIFIAPTRH